MSLRGGKVVILRDKSKPELPRLSPNSLVEVLESPQSLNGVPGMIIKEWEACCLPHVIMMKQAWGTVSDMYVVKIPTLRNPEDSSGYWVIPREYLRLKEEPTSFYQFKDGRKAA
jgi:hypothetical protein